MSTTTLRPAATASPAYQPRTFRPVSPFPPTSTTVGGNAAPIPAPRNPTVVPKLDYPLPSRPITPMPPSQPARLGADRIGAVAPAGLPMPAPTDERLHHHRSGSSLRNEVKPGASAEKRRHQPWGRPSSTERRDGDRAKASQEVEDGEVREVTAAMEKNAHQVLQMLAALPAPLPEMLPPTFLPTPSSTPSPPSGSFTSFARMMSASTSPRSSAGSSSLGKRRRSSSGGPPLVGLGLSGAESSTSKKARGKGGVSMTPTTSTFGFGGKTISPEMRRALSGGATGIKAPFIEGKDTWTKGKWTSASSSYKARAILLKRHGDAHLRLAGAKPQFLHLAADTLMGLLSLTDAVLLWLYAYWCDEQAEGRVSTKPYKESQALRDYVKVEWEKWVRKGWSEYAGVEEHEREGLREMGKGMIGLMYLIEAVVYYHLSAEQLHHLNRRSAQINALAPSAMAPTTSIPGIAGPTPTLSSSSTLPLQNAPGAHTSPNSESPSQSVGPSPHSASSSSHPEIPTEIMGLIATSTTQSSRAASNLLHSRHHLPLSLLRSRFPGTYDLAVNSELADESLPPPNDPLGAARKVDIDTLERFVWPIELGMCAPMAHMTIFGRALVREMAETAGREWDTEIGVVP